MMIAMLILAIVLTGIAPVFYGLLKAAAVTNDKSVANGLAVQSTEQMRSLPYYEVGFYTTPTGCPATAPVLLSTSTTAPLASLPTTETVGNVTYSIQRCVNWINSSITNDTLAYKESVVTVSWAVAGLSSSVSQVSELYPGGDGAYTTGGENDYAPAATTTTTGTAPSAPVTVTALDDTSSPGTEIDVSWSAAAGATSYNIWFVSTNPNGYAVSTISGASEDADVTATSAVIDVNPSTNYYIQVVAVSSGGTSNPTSATPYPLNSGSTSSPTTTTSTTSTTSTTVPGSTTTSTSTTTTSTSTSTTSTTVGTCRITADGISPAGQNLKNQQAVLNSSDQLSNNGVSQFTVTVTVSVTGGSCVPIVYYAPSGCTPNASGCTTGTLTFSSVSGNQYTFLTSPSQVWADQSLQQFMPSVNGTTFNPAQSYVCIVNGGGNCK